MNGILIDIIQVFRKRHGDLGSLITIEYSLVIDSVDVSGRYIPKYQIFIFYIAETA